MHHHYILQNLTWTKYLPLSVSFTLPSVFMMLTSIHLFPLRASAFSICCKAALEAMNSLSFCLRNSLSLLHFWRTAWLDIAFLVTDFSFTTEYIILLSCPATFLLRNPSTDSLMEVPVYMMSHFSPAAFKILSLSLALDNLIIMCLVEDFFMFSLFGVLCTSRI